MIDWFETPSPFPEIRCWGAIQEPFQYVLSYDELEDRYFVSGKRYPNQGTRINLGVYRTKGDAILAAETHWSNNR